MRGMAFALLTALTVGGCSESATPKVDPELAALAKSGPFGQLAAALVEGNADKVRDLGQDKFAYIHKEKGSMSTAVGKVDVEKFMTKIGKCRSNEVREVGQKTKLGYDVPGGDVVVTCGEVVSGCGPSIFAFFTNGELGKTAVKVESQHTGPNSCLPPMNMFAEEGKTVG